MLLLHLMTLRLWKLQLLLMLLLILKKPGQEWQQIKQVVKHQGYPRPSTAKLWGLIKEFHGDDYPNLIKLVQLALAHPVHTADCERAFSALNGITTPLRNKLSPDHCDQLM